MNFPKADTSLANTINAIAKRNEIILNDILKQIKHAISIGDTQIDFERLPSNKQEIVRYLKYHEYRVWFKEGDVLGISWDGVK